MSTIVQRVKEASISRPLADEKELDRRIRRNISAMKARMK
jgi:hypothetical protein